LEIRHRLLIVNFKGELTLALPFAKGRVTLILRGLKNFFELAFSSSLYGKERRSKRR
jgi:hypothetical protein